MFTLFWELTAWLGGGKGGLLLHAQVLILFKGFFPCLRGGYQNYITSMSWAKCRPAPMFRVLSQEGSGGEKTQLGAKSVFFSLSCMLLLSSQKSPLAGFANSRKIFFSTFLDKIDLYPTPAKDTSSVLCVGVAM